LYDPYQSWHTDNDRPDGGNYTGFGNAESDRLIDAIRKEMNEDRRNELYREFQELLYDQQPGIFLFAPKDGLLVHKRFEAFSGPRRPGFFPALYQVKKEK
jgi:peptide/nickel transport system substrate-binding protein